jgi:hypothetical protein
MQGIWFSLFVNPAGLPKAILMIPNYSYPHSCALPLVNLRFPKAKPQIKDLALSFYSLT